MQPYKYYYERNLPHYQPKHSSFFITYRLHGSIPNPTIRKLKAEYSLRKDFWSTLSAQARIELQEEYFQEFDAQLDNRLNEPYWLEDDRIARIVQDSLLYNDMKQYLLWCYTLMPNHVHVLLSLMEDSLPLYSILQKHKRFTAWQCNKILQCSGHFWTHESYDHVVRDEYEFSKIVRYILMNPVKAGYAVNWKDWKWTYLREELYPALTDLHLEFSLIPSAFVSTIRATLE